MRRSAPRTSCENRQLFHTVIDETSFDDELGNRILAGLDLI
jgi:hypothetical protein